MNYKAVLFLIWIVLVTVVYVPVGVMIMKRYKKKSIRNRSSNLVVIIHWVNYLKCNLHLISLFFTFSGVLNTTWNSLYKTFSIFLQFAFFCPFILRCYRVYFIFKLDQNIDEADSSFRRNIHRLSQTWLLKVYIAYMIPVFVVSCAITILDETGPYFPIDLNKWHSNRSYLSALIYLNISFLEELAFIFAVYALRNVNDDYNMTRELTFICALWILCVTVSVFMTDVIWMITIISKDNVIMVICSVYPLYKSYDETQFEENLTLEMLQSLDLILQCRTTLEAFEASISDVKILIKDHQASEYFQLWLKCEYSKYSPDNFIVANEALQAATNFKLEDPSNIVKIQSEVYDILNEICFPHFKRSTIYTDLMRDITKQQIYINRILQASF